VGGFWPRIYVLKKGHARDIYFLLFIITDAQFLALRSAPPLLSLRAAISYLLASAFHRAAVLAPLTSSSDLVVLPI
jgi:hypothetical protein